MLFRRSSREQGHWLGVTQEGALATAAQVSTSPEGRPRLDWFWRTDTDSIGGALKALQRQHALRGACLAGLLPHNHYRIVAADAPSVPREEWRDAIRWSLRDQVDFTVDDAIIDVLALPTAAQIRQSSQTLTVLVPSAAHAEITQAADDQALNWRALDVPETALRNICALGEEKDKAHALLAFGEQHALLVITFQGELIMMRHIDVTLASVTTQGESQNGALSRAALEVLRTLDTHERLHSQAPLSCLTVALPPGTDVNNLAVLAELFYLPVKALNLADLMDIAAGEDTVRPPAKRSTLIDLLSIGAALRGWRTEQGQQQLQLIDPDSANRRSVPWAARTGVLLTSSAVLMCALMAGGLSWMQREAGQQLKAAELKKAERQQQLSALAASPVVKELEQLREREKIQRQMREVLIGVEVQASTGYANYLLALSRQAQSQLWLTGLLIEGDANNLELRGRTTDPARLIPYLSSLNKEDLFKGRRFAQVEMKAIGGEADSPQGVTEFVLRGQLPDREKTGRRIREDER